MTIFCRYFNQSVCKSCDLITIDYSVQVAYKEDTLRTSLKHLKIPALDLSVSSSQISFRNKAKFAVTGDIQNPVIGLTGEDHLDQGRELLECPLHVEQINKILPQIKNFITLSNLVPYQIKEKKGELKGIILYYSVNSDEGYIRFILRSKESLDRIRKNLSFFKELANWKSISANIQPIPHAVLEGDEEIWFTDKTTIKNRLGNFEFTLSPQGFVQTNQKVAEELYKEAAAWIRDLSVNKMLELYCGQGPFSFFASEEVQESLGIEINAQSVDSANAIAKSMNKSHLKFVQSDAAEMKAKSVEYHPDLILVNPPRRGLGETVQLLNEVRSRYIIYSSCDHETLAKDLSLVRGYSIQKIKMFDMFPHTKHFETLVLLKRD